MNTHGGLILIFAFLFLWWPAICNGKSNTKNISLVILRPKPEGNFNSNMGAGAVLAINDINDNHPLVGGDKQNYTIVPRWFMPGCNDSESLNQVVSAYKNLTHGYIGPECSKSVESIALLARGWNTIMVTYGASTPTVSDHNRYTTFARSIPPYNMMGDAVAELFLHYKWNKHICILTAVEDIWMKTAMKLKTSLEQKGIEPIHVQYIFPSELDIVDNDHPDGNEPDNIISETVKNLRNIARIVIILTYDDYKVLYYAKKHRMLNGEYTFLVIEGVKNHLIHGLGSFGIEPEDFKEVLTGLFSISYSPLDETTAEYQEFKDQLQVAVKELPETEETNGKPPPDDQDEIIYEAFIHDAVMLFAKGLNKTLQDEEVVFTGEEKIGTNIRDNIDGISFEGKSGMVNMSNGDRRSDFLIQNYQTDLFVNAFIHRQADDIIESLGNKVLFPGGKTDPPNPCGKDNELCKDNSDRKMMIGAIAISFSATLATCLCAVLLWRIYIKKKIMRRMWEIKLRDVIYVNDHAALKMGSGMSLPSAAISFINGGDQQWNSTNFTRKAIINNKTVYLKRTQKQSVNITNCFLKEVQQLYEARNPNIAEFVGISLTPESIFIATTYCSKQSLQDIISSERIKLDMMFKMALAGDLVKAMVYLHRSVIQFHGNLNSSNCLVDDHWTLKICDFGMRHVRKTLGDNTFKSGMALKEADLWRAPEFINAPKYTGSAPGDIYSVGIVLQEIVCESYPYPNCDYSTDEILEKVPFGFRPKIVHEHASKPLINTIERCWETSPADRISLQDIKKVLHDLNPDRRISLTDRMMKMMDKYTDQLENLVEERTTQLAEEKNKADQLLYSMLPRPVAEKLKLGEPVLAEAFNICSIYFSDVVGFTDLSSKSTPLQVVDLLSDLYTLFDQIADKFDCYKVETIGDAYMVVSGIPQSNGDRHSYEIAALALNLLQSISTFTVRHLPGEKLKLRIGIHSGPCAAGVVGVKMPRYCLFGDTVNTASRMESNGQALRIHTSEAFRDELQKHGDEFQMEERGEMTIKGKGTMKTFWLNGRKTNPEQTLWIPGTTNSSTKSRTLPPLSNTPHSSSTSSTVLTHSSNNGNDSVSEYPLTEINIQPADDFSNTKQGLRESATHDVVELDDSTSSLIPTFIISNVDDNMHMARIV